MKFKNALNILFSTGAFVAALSAGAEIGGTNSIQASEVTEIQAELPLFFTSGCNSPEMQEWFENCIYRRANCWEYNPGGYCYGAPSAWGRCTGRRPPQLGC